MPNFRFALRIPFLALLAMPIARHANAQDAPRPHPCVASPLHSNLPVNARERVGPSAFMAMASFDTDGWPTITYAPAYFALPPTLQAFLALHECGHLVLRTTNEFAANCYALRQGRWSPSDLAMIKLSHLSIGPLPPQYGGSGPAFWAGTQALCPELFAR